MSVDGSPDPRVIHRLIGRREVHPHVGAGAFVVSEMALRPNDPESSWMSH